MPTFTNNVVIVTAAGSPVGRAVALRLAAEGARLALVDTDAPGGHETLSLVAAATDALFIAADVSDEAGVASVRERVLDAYNTAHGLIHVVDIGAPRPLHELSEADWDATLRRCLTSVYLGYRTFIPLMLQAGGGSLVTVAPLRALAGRLDYAAAAAAVGAIVTLTKATAVDFAAQGIRVNVVCPSEAEPPAPVASPSLAAGEAPAQAFLARHPMQRLARPEEVAEAAVWLTSAAAAFITGVALPIDGGLTAW